jgi:flagellar protein FliO/FliZ
MEFDIYFRFLAVLAFVLALIGLLTWLVRRVGPARRMLRPRGGQRRLAIVEIAPIDAKRRLVLVRRDGTEHLIMLGTTSDLLIEAGIAAAPRQANREDAA